MWICTAEIANGNEPLREAVGWGSPLLSLSALGHLSVPRAQRAWEWVGPPPWERRGAVTSSLEFSDSLGKGQLGPKNQGEDMALLGPAVATAVQVQSLWGQDDVARSQFLRCRAQRLKSVW